MAIQILKIFFLFYKNNGCRIVQCSRLTWLGGSGFETLHSINAIRSGWAANRIFLLKLAITITKRRRKRRVEVEGFCLKDRESIII